jgi:DNA-binding response OmpR family regulator/anti-sigma regulatory factor (Ser/Thr protein kinase)
MTAESTLSTAPVQLETILIIDDEVQLSAALAENLEINGYRVLCASDANMGWEFAHAHLPDLILCDIEMPDKDGRRLLQEMRADPELAHRQFVLMTGKEDFANPRAAMDLGADDFLLKPFALSELLRCVVARLKRAALSRRINDNVLAELRLSLQPTLPHKLFTPLAGILGLTRLLEEGLDSLRAEEIRQDLRDIQDAGRQLHRSLRNYLLLMELESEGLVRSSAWLDGETVVDELNAGITTAGTRHHRVADIVRDLTGASLRANPSDLGTVAEELVDNALRFSRHGTPVQVRAWADGTVMHLTVTDAGRGMTALQLEQIAAVQRLEGNLRSQQDLGFGLILVHRLILHIGGELRIESEAGKGTTSHVTLPCGHL